MTPFQTFSTKLGELLASARTASQKEDVGARLAVIDQLTQFVIDSAPNTPDILALDRLAQSVINDLALSTIQERVARIAARTAELAALRKQFDAAAGAANAAAAAINLEQINKTTNALTAAVASLKELQQSLTSGQHGQLATRISDAIKSFQQLRNEVDALV